MEWKIFNDAVLGAMTFHPLLVVVTDTPQVQRLRNIRQLGACNFIFPSATHSRFEHSLGTAFIAGQLFDKLKEKRLPATVTDDAEWEKQKLCGQVAGLCHDLGHGPFSHTWELFRQRVGDDWSHDVESVKVFEDLLKEEVSPNKRFNGKRLKTVQDVFSFYELTEEHVELIKKMILGQKKEKNYLFQVISNKNNGIDVDKWEYITRDSVMLNIPVSFDFKRLLNFCCIIPNEVGEEQICFRDKECPQLAEMFLARARLHDYAYKHTKVKIVEEMLLDTFELANERLSLASTPVSQLTDHIYQKILYDSFGADKSMKKAKRLLRRLERRHLYKCIAQKSFVGNVPEIGVIRNELSSIEGIELYLPDIGMTTVSINMTKPNSKRPLKNVNSYRKTKVGQYVCEPFNWSSHNSSIKVNLEKTKRNQVLLLYKGTRRFPESLKAPIARKLHQILRE